MPYGPVVTMDLAVSQWLVPCYPCPGRDPSAPQLIPGAWLSWCARGAGG